MNCLRIFSTSSKIEACLEDIKEIPSIAMHASRCTSYHHAPHLVHSAIMCCSTLCKSGMLQKLIVENGTVWHLFPYLFHFDSEIEDLALKTKEAQEQLFINDTAKAALICLRASSGMLASMHYPHNPAVCAVLQRTLPEKIISDMKSKDMIVAQALQWLNTNQETPYSIWNNKTRFELCELCEVRSKMALNGDMSHMAIDDFVYTSHQSEMQLNKVYLRVYVEQPKYPIINPPQLFQAIVEFVKGVVGGESHELSRIQLAVKALRVVLSAYPSLSSLASSSLPITMSLFDLGSNVVNAAYLEYLIECCKHVEFANQLCGISTSVATIMLSMSGDDAPYYLALQVLYKMLCNRESVHQALDHGLYIMLFDRFIKTHSANEKERSIECLARMLGESQYGTKINSELQKMIPDIFVYKIKEGPQQFTVLFEGQTENPELVWNSMTRERFSRYINDSSLSIIEGLRKDRSVSWNPTDALEYPVNEIQVSGVYLALFVKQPDWEVKKPRDFMLALFEKYMEIIESEKESEELVKLVTNCIIGFIRSHPTIIEYIASLRQIPKIIRHVNSQSYTVAHSAIQLLRGISLCTACVDSMSNDDPIDPLLHAMKRFPDDVDLALQTMERLVIHSEKGTMIKFISVNGALPELLAMLETGFVGNHKAHVLCAMVVKVIQTILNVKHPTYGEKLSQEVEKSKVWWKHKNQKHDQFLDPNAEPKH